MKKCTSNIYQALHAIYSKHRTKHRENPDSKQMCCMWSRGDPPDTIEGTEPFCDIEDKFGIQINDVDGLLLYDMDLDQAAQKIQALRQSEY